MFWQGTTDDGAWKLAELLGWKAELQKLVETEYKKFSEREKKDTTTVATIDTASDKVVDGGPNKS